MSDYGTIIEGSALRTVEEMDAEIVRFAQFHGMTYVPEDADEAIAWLNEHVAGPREAYILDDGLIYVPLDEDEF